MKDQEFSRPREEFSPTGQEFARPTAEFSPPGREHHMAGPEEGQATPPPPKKRRKGISSLMLTTAAVVTASVVLTSAPTRQLASKFPLSAEYCIYMDSLEDALVKQDSDALLTLLTSPTIFSF